MGFHELIETVLRFVHAHGSWAVPITFAVAFGESLAFLSLLIPGTFILIGMGALIGSSDISFWPVWGSAALGAALGDWLSYWIGLRFEHRIVNAWPLSRHPQLLSKAHAFFEMWGVLGVFIGRFFGPLRATIPLAAGISEMPFLFFQFANFTSALLWAFAVLGPGAFGMKWIADWLT